MDRDLNRFRQIIRGKIKENLRKYISGGEMIGKKGKDLISIPVPYIDLPRFRHGENNQKGIGQGEGKTGDALGGNNKDGNSGAGNRPGYHLREVEMTIDELAEIMGEELQLPNIQPRDKKNIMTEKYRFSSIRRNGPESLRHFKRTFLEALKRQIALGKFVPRKPKIIPIRDDYRYRSWKSYQMPHANAVIIYIMDISGSMFGEQKEIVRAETFWIDIWLQHHYKGLETRFIVHDATAKEVDRETFFTLRESGGTLIAPAYQLCANIIKKHYPPNLWNIYVFHFSDGDNWGSDDDQKSLSILNEFILPSVNLFGYGQVKGAFGSGDFYNVLEKGCTEYSNIILSEIPNKESIYDSIKDFLGKGR